MFLDTSSKFRHTAQVPDHWCTPAGDEIAKKVGEELVKEGVVNLDLPLRVTSDASSRRDDPR